MTEPALRRKGWLVAESSISQVEEPVSGLVGLHRDQRGIRSERNVVRIDRLMTTAASGSLAPTGPLSAGRGARGGVGTAAATVAAATAAAIAAAASLRRHRSHAAMQFAPTLCM